MSYDPNPTYNQSSTNKRITVPLPSLDDTTDTNDATPATSYLNPYASLTGPLPATGTSPYPRPAWLTAIRNIFAYYYLAIIILLFAVYSGMSLYTATHPAKSLAVQDSTLLIEALVLLGLIIIVATLAFFAKRDANTETRLKAEAALASYPSYAPSPSWGSAVSAPLLPLQRMDLTGMNVLNARILREITRNEIIEQIELSVDGRVVALQSGGKIYLWRDYQWATEPEFRFMEGASQKNVNTKFALSPNGRMLAVFNYVSTPVPVPAKSPYAFGNDYNTQLNIWDTQTGQLKWLLDEGRQYIPSGDYHQLTWSPDNSLLAVVDSTTVIYNDDASHSAQQNSLWNVEDGTFVKRFHGSGRVAWSADMSVFASTLSQSIHVEDHSSPSLVEERDTVALPMLTASDPNGWNRNYLMCIGLSPRGAILAACYYEGQVTIADTRTGQLLRTLEGHTVGVDVVQFSEDGSLLFTRDTSNRAYIWRTENWTMEAAIEDIALSLVGWGQSNIYDAVSFQGKLLFGLLKDANTLRIYEVGLEGLLNAAPTKVAVSYANAKVVLVGDSGVGKSGLGLVLSNQQFEVTESTHGRHVWTFASEEVEVAEMQREQRETLLWDLAGQPGYRMIHQLYLNEVAVAMIVFDGKSETDPFGGVYHWVRALAQAQQMQSSTAFPLKKFLVSARMDRGGAGVSRYRIEELLEEHGFEGYFETSASKGWQIPELRSAIRNAIDWNALPKVSSTALFQEIKAFLINEKKAGHLLFTVEELYNLFMSKHPARQQENLQAQFETCIGRVESAGLIKRLSFGNRVLLQPELLDAYASALVNAVRDEPDGLGNIAEEDVRAGRFRMPDDERIRDKDQEKLLLIAMIEDLIRRDLIIREDKFLVFPSQSTRENPDLPDPEGKAVVFSFEGPVLNIYATLAVRVANSDLFQKKDMWKNAITYTPAIGGGCGMFLRNIGEGRGDLTLFYDRGTGEETRRYFEEYVYLHLKRRALQDTVQRRRIFSCSNCGFLVPEQLQRIRQELGYDWLTCPACERNRISLVEQEAAPSRQVALMDRAADKERDKQGAILTVEGKKETQDFDVFLCYNTKDRPFVRDVSEELKQRGLLPWLDVDVLPPGTVWQKVLGSQIKNIKSVAVFVGKDSIGTWQEQEIYSFLAEFNRRKCPVIPVFLANAPDDVLDHPDMPVFLKNMGWVDFRQQDPNPFDNLVWGITGKRPVSTRLAPSRNVNA